MSGHLYLVGFMGAGKSTIGPILRDRLERDFFDLDEKIVAEAGMPIHRIFNEEGERYFRNLESRLLRRISRSKPLIIGLGGGAFMSNLNRSQILRTGTSIWLQVSFRNAWERCSGEGTRPLAGNLSQFQELYRQRQHTYQKCDLHVATDEMDPESVCDKIINLLQSLEPR